MVQRYFMGWDSIMEPDPEGDWVKHEHYEKLKVAAEALLKEAAVVYSRYNATIAPDFVDMQTLQELSDVL